MDTIRLAGVIEESYTDGIGIRATIFTQGCKHKCKECHNPETWSFEAGKDYKIDDIIEMVKNNPLLDGVTISGGDPMYRTNEVLNIIKRIKQDTNLNIWVYTGFTFEECMQDKDKLAILKEINVLVDGEYKCELRSLNLRFRGSSNQRIIDVQDTLKNNKIKLLIED